MMINMQNI